MALLTILVTNASVVYTDLNPDQTLINSSFSVDMDGDSNAEFDLDNWSTPPSSYYSGSSVWATGVEMIESSTTLGYLEIINSGMTIGAASNFVSSGVLDLFQTSSDPWIGQSQKYIGVKFLINSNVHYGWVEVSINPSTYETTIHGFAYETVPNTSILAGDKGVTGFQSDLIGEREFATIFPNPSKGRVTILADNIKSIIVIDVAGKIVYSEKYDGAENNKTLDMNNLPYGVYYLNLESSCCEKTEKIVIN